MGNGRVLGQHPDAVRPQRLGLVGGQVVGGEEVDRRTVRVPHEVPGQVYRASNAPNALRMGRVGSPEDVLVLEEPDRTATATADATCIASAPFSTLSTNARHCSAVAAGKSAASARSGVVVTVVLQRGTGHRCAPRIPEA